MPQPQDETEVDVVTDFDVVIVGGGMVGASAACALAGTGLRLAVLDSQGLAPRGTTSAGFDPRVSAITPGSTRFFARLGVWDDMLQQRCSPYTDMHVWDADGTGSIHFAACDIHADELGHIVENSVILRALHAALARHPDITLLAPVALDALRSVPGGVQLLLEDQRCLRTRLLVAADGANSRVRELAGFKTREWDYEHHAIVTTVRTALPHRATAIQRFMDAGTLAFLPLRSHGPGVADDHRHCSIVWSVLPDHARELMALDDVAFAATLQAAIENRLGRIEHVDARHCFPLRQRHAVDYVQGSIALIGDAAHTIHPLAGQGVNLGLLDAEALAAQVLEAHAQGRDFADLRTLRRYQRRRMAHNLGMMWVMEGFKHLFADQPLPIRWLRNAGMSALDSTAMLKHRVMRSAMGSE